MLEEIQHCYVLVLEWRQDQGGRFVLVHLTTCLSKAFRNPVGTGDGNTLLPAAHAVDYLILRLGFGHAKDNAMRGARSSALLAALYGWNSFLSIRSGETQTVHSIYWLVLMVADVLT